MAEKKLAPHQANLSPAGVAAAKKQMAASFFDIAERMLDAQSLEYLTADIVAAKFTSSYRLVALIPDGEYELRQWLVWMLDLDLIERQKRSQL